MIKYCVAGEAKNKSLLYRSSIYTHYTELYVVRVGPAELIPYRLSLWLRWWVIHFSASPKNKRP